MHCSDMRSTTVPHSYSPFSIMTKLVSMLKLPSGLMVGNFCCKTPLIKIFLSIDNSLAKLFDGEVVAGSGN